MIHPITMSESFLEFINQSNSPSKIVFLKCNVHVNVFHADNLSVMDK